MASLFNREAFHILVSWVAAGGETKPKEASVAWPVRHPACLVLDDDDTDVGCDDNDAGSGEGWIGGMLVAMKMTSRQG